MASTGTLRVVLLWHMHQPYYKDLVTGEYRLPWVRMHALKDYYGMVKLLDEFPQVHQNFNMVPSLVAQIQDYVAGTARDPFLQLAGKPAGEMALPDRLFALRYLFQANVVQMIGRYPRYRELWERYHGTGEDPVKAELYFSTRDYVDLQVLSQLAWFDEFFLEQPDVQELVRKGRNFSQNDQSLMLAKQKEIMSAVLPAYAQAAKRGGIEISATPYYHPILPLVCDTSEGAISSPGLATPDARFRHPEDAQEQIRRALVLHEEVFGMRPRGMWPSEGSVSEQVLALAAKEGIEWMATDEGVLGRTKGYGFERNSAGTLRADSAERLYNIYRYEKAGTEMNLVFRDHRLSDLIGFVYAGMKANDAAAHLLANLKESAAPMLRSGRDAVVSIILDGENAWETYDMSGREFLRRFYDSLQKEPGVEAVTISEAIERHKPAQFGRLNSLVPGSWINANFNVWIGAQEDNKAWDYLSEARDFYDLNSKKATVEQRALAFEELLIAEGSDWNWWYGPEHHSANDRDFDELYRKHLSNVYQALGGLPPEYLARPIATGITRASAIPQTAYIHPKIDGRVSSYFDWIGAAMYTADRHSSAMHGKEFLLDAVYTGIDEKHLYGRIDFAGEVRAEDFDLLVHMEVVSDKHSRALRFSSQVAGRRISRWGLQAEGSTEPLTSSDETVAEIEVGLERIFEFRVPLAAIGAVEGDTVRLRFSIWRDRLPIDALPLEGSIELQVAKEYTLEENVYNAAYYRGTRS
ncbi:MAG TPA: glycoside hydrolase family 57 protein [Clostridia bacterium]|nr:glycoside hydrolase family 57 protein [Clostridia bacterium]